MISFPQNPRLNHIYKILFAIQGNRFTGLEMRTWTCYSPSLHPVLPISRKPRHSSLPLISGPLMERFLSSFLPSSSMMSSLDLLLPQSLCALHLIPLGFSFLASWALSSLIFSPPQAIQKFCSDRGLHCFPSKHALWLHQDLDSKFWSVSYPLSG